MTRATSIKERAGMMIEKRRFYKTGICAERIDRRNPSVATICTWFAVKGGSDACQSRARIIGGRGE